MPTDDTLWIFLGQVEFTIEVVHALRVLDGAVLVLCVVSGVQVGSPVMAYTIHVRAETKLSLQGQTITVDRQMRRYNVPRLSSSTKWRGALVAIIDLRLFSDPSLQTWCEPVALSQIQTKLRMPAAAVQVPTGIGIEDQLEGVVDLVRWKAMYNKGVKR